MTPGQAHVTAQLEELQRFAQYAIDAIKNGHVVDDPRSSPANYDYRLGKFGVTDLSKRPFFESYDREKNCWIKVTEKLPAKHGETIVFAKEYPGPQEDGSMSPSHSWHLGWYNGTGFYDQAKHELIQNVVQWRPLGKMQP